METKQGRRRLARRAATLAALVGLALGCGGGERSIVGIGNSGNRMGPSQLAEEIAKAFAKVGGTPRVEDALVRSLYDRMLEQAREGDPQAMLVVLELAVRQRKAEAQD